MMFVIAMSAFKLGHSCFKFIKSRSNPPAPGNSHMPSQSNKGNATHEAAPVLACPTVPSSNTNSCNAGVVSTAGCCFLHAGASFCLFLAMQNSS